MSDRLVRVLGRRNSTWLRKGQTRLTEYTPELQLFADAGWVEILDDPPTVRDLADEADMQHRSRLAHEGELPEVTVTVNGVEIPGVYHCDCGKEYKTQKGFTAHQKIHGSGE